MTAESIAPGTVLAGRYRLDDLLSEHRGARFWRGVDTVLNRSVAVNVVPSDDPRGSALLDAARTSATVTDPHLLRVLDCDETEGITWVVNEWGEGASLDVLLQRGPLPAARAAWLVREVARTIVAAHDAGVAHGRLTPESVLVTEAGAVRLIGFVVTAAIEGPAARNHRARTRGYADLGPLDSDVIDLAGILYAALTGRWPGISPSAVPDAPQDQRGPMRPRQVRAGVPRMLDAICARVLRKEAHEHALPIDNAKEVLAALENHMGEHEVAVDGHTAMHDDEPVMPVVPVNRARAAVPARAPAWTGDPEATQASAPPVWDGERDDAEEANAPPPFEQPAERPLFASADRRPSPPAEPGSAAWLFGDDEPAASPIREDGRPRPLRIGLLALAAVAVLAAMVVAFLVGRGGSDHPKSSGETGSGSTTGSTPSAAVQPVSVHDFDPEGKGPHGRPAPEENPGEVPLATDGNPATGWHTLTYTSATLGGLKSGVGLLVDLGEDHPVGSVDVTFTGTPTSFEMYAAPGGVSNPPTGLAGLDRVGEMRADEPDVTLRLDQTVHTRYLVLWLTDLPRQGAGYRGQVDEFSVRT